jgi:hypothetical protein
VLGWLSCVRRASRSGTRGAGRRDSHFGGRHRTSCYRVRCWRGGAPFWASRRGTRHPDIGFRPFGAVFIWIRGRSCIDRSSSRDPLHAPPAALCPPTERGALRPDQGHGGHARSSPTQSACDGEPGSRRPSGGRVAAWNLNLQIYHPQLHIPLSSGRGCALLSTAAAPPHTFPTEMRGQRRRRPQRALLPPLLQRPPAASLPQTCMPQPAPYCVAGSKGAPPRALSRVRIGENAPFAMPHAHTPAVPPSPGELRVPPCAPWCAPQLTAGCVAHTNPRPTAATAPSGGGVCPSAANRRRQPHAARHLHASPASSPASMPASPPTVQAPRSNAAAFFLHQRPPPHSLASPCQLCSCHDSLPIAQPPWTPITEPRPVASPAGPGGASQDVLRGLTLQHRPRRGHRCW